MNNNNEQLSYINGSQSVGRDPQWGRQVILVGSHKDIESLEKINVQKYTKINVINDKNAVKESSDFFLLR